MASTPINVSISLVLYALLAPFSLFLSSSDKVFAFDGDQTFHTVQISSLRPSSVCSPSTKDHSERGSMKVVHRHGPCSELNQDQTSAPTLTEILFHDQSRVNSIQDRLNFNKAQKISSKGSRTTLPAKSGNSIGSANYIVTVGLGTPKRSLSLMFDTGSGLTWTQCQKCVNSTRCSQLTSATGISPGCANSTCIYGIQYGDSSTSIGFLASEKLTLTSSNVFPNFIFGCGNNNRGLFSGAAGLLGLDRDPFSAVSQTASRFGKYFSYCLPTPSSSAGTLTFGKGVTNSSTVQFTPSPVHPKARSFYFVNIIGIKVGGQNLSISESVFKTPGTIIDSGTVITRLAPAAYAALRTAFQQALKNYTLIEGISIFDTCYDFTGYDTVTIPRINFLFAGNIEVPIDISGILYDVGLSRFCLAFAGNSDASDVGIFGNVQQQTLDVVYDVAGGKIGFGTGGCS
ncbi:hypothetical protein RHSIM_Rhsim02G0218800 [Rhododendron simsii]|uniref:Peptidase A1 domain-containing protein n=1 Tax=Rhododendron simsii TaxID=118357 RepID=A0A834HEF1_RHOSS|nr:hypothetical protein RHSIM_Rhsim02G0218800 [Rhododendron simsii]